MSNIPFEEIINTLAELDSNQKQQLITILLGSPLTTSTLPAIEKIRELRFHDGLYCPHCTARGPFKRNGTYRGRQRYLCYSCRRTFNDFTGTPIHHTHYPDKWAEYLKCMEQGLSIRKSAKIVGITVPTAFSWRHKILHALSEIRNQSLEGIVEADEMYLLYSEKGKRRLPREARKRGGVASTRGISKEQLCILVARDRAKNTISEAVTFGRLDARRLDSILSYRLQPGIILCTDEEQTFRKYCRENQIQHERVNPGKKRFVTKEIYHIQNVHAFNSRFRSFIRPFHGVATKYVNHYLAWHSYLDETTSLLPKFRAEEMMLNALLQPMKTVGIRIPQYCETKLKEIAS